MAIVVARHAKHQVETALALRQGMVACGDTADVITSDSEFLARLGDFDAVCCWGWRRGNSLRGTGKDVLVMERAYIGDRFHWTSLGWNGLNGRAQWPDVTDPSRWMTHFDGMLKDWKPANGAVNTALLLGQVPSDAACRHVHLESWLTNVAARLKQMGIRVTFRPHPKAPFLRVGGTATSRMGPLSEDLMDADMAINFNSNAGVEAVLAGVPTVSYDVGSMAWSVSSHSIDERRVTPSRNEWAYRMAWRQWLPEEISTGIAWKSVREVAK